MGEHLVGILKNLGNAGAVDNAKAELVASHGRVVTAAVVARRVAARDEATGGRAAPPRSGRSLSRAA